MSKIRNTGISSLGPISRLTGKLATQKLKNFCNSSLWTYLHYMVTKMKKSYFLIILV